MSASMPTPTPSQPPPSPARKNALWPEVDDPVSARKAAKQGAVASFFVAGVTALASLLGASGSLGFGQLGFSYWSLLDAGIFLGVGIGIWRMSRAAAVIGLVFYLVERIYMLVQHPDQASKGIFMAVIIAGAFISSIRGTFAVHRFTVARALPTDPVRPQ